MPSVKQLAQQFEVQGTDVRKKFIFAGHGGVEGLLRLCDGAGEHHLCVLRV